MFICVYICIYIYIDRWIDRYMYMYIYMYIYIYIYVYMCIYIFFYLDISIYMYVCVCVYNIWLTVFITCADLAGVTLSKFDVSSKIVKAEIVKHPADGRCLSVYIYGYR